MVRSRALNVALTAGLLAVCGSPPAPAADHSVPAYELVVLQKPDTVEGYAKIPRAYYDLCANLTHALNLPTKPFPQLPASLGSQRSTYVIRGWDSVYRHEFLGEFNVSKMDLDHLCEVDVVVDNSPEVQIVVGATRTSIDTDENNHITVTTEDLSDLHAFDRSRPAKSTAEYTDSRTVNGIPLRCLPAGKPPLDPVLITEMCIYAHDGVLVHDDREPIMLAARVKPGPALPYFTITEPQSLRILEHPESQFDVATYTR